MLLKLTKVCVFSVNNKLIKQIDGCPMDDTYIRRKKNEPDSLFEKLNSYHPNIKLTIGKNPTKFVDTEIIRRGSEIETKVHCMFLSCHVRVSE